MSLTITITGLDQILKKTDPQRFVQVLDQAIDRSAEALRDRTKTMPAVSGPRTGYDAKGIPVDTGRMRQSIQKRKTQLLAANVIARTNYSGYVHGGTSRVPERPFFLYALRDFGGKEQIERIVKDYLSRFFR